MRFVSGGWARGKDEREQEGFGKVMEGKEEVGRKGWTREKVDEGWQR